MSVAYAAWLYRVDRLEEAVTWLEKITEQDHEGFTLCFLAMAHHRLGHEEDALRHATEIRRRKAAWTEFTPWFERIRSGGLIAEMDAVLAGPPDVIREPETEADEPPPIRQDGAAST